MMWTKRLSDWRPSVVLLAALLGSPAAADDTVGPAEALASFRKAWQPLAGRQYMRPLDDAGWRARLEGFQRLARAGDKAAPVLADALAKGDDETRVFAAQALALLPDPDARPALKAALKDRHPTVRLYALDALALFGKLPEEEPYTTLRQKDANRDVRSHAGFAIGRDDRPRPEVIRKALADFDLNQVATARVGKPAPDFTLNDPRGKSTRLADFRGKKPVVLVFVYGAT